MKFKKILVSKHNPKNKCYSDDGEWLIIGQSEHIMKSKLPKDYHFFVGINSKQPSQYGWVASIGFEIAAEELAQKYEPNPSKEFIESCELLLNAVKDQKEGVPMACTFSTVGVMEKRRVLKVHRVFFYDA